MIVDVFCFFPRDEEFVERGGGEMWLFELEGGEGGEGSRDGLLAPIADERRKWLRGFLLPFDWRRYWNGRRSWNAARSGGEWSRVVLNLHPFLLQLDDRLLLHFPLDRPTHHHSSLEEPLNPLLPRLNLFQPTKAQLNIRIRPNFDSIRLQIRLSYLLPLHSRVDGDSEELRGVFENVTDFEFRDEGEGDLV